MKIKIFILYSVQYILFGPPAAALRGAFCWMVSVSSRALSATTLLATCATVATRRALPVTALTPAVATPVHLTQ